ncbi:MAG: LiaF transmembrane domain-containing protein [Burkholderiaceae bacterium]
MFRHARLHPHVHIVRWQAFRAARRITFGAALILLGIGSLLRSQGLIDRDELWLVLPAVITLSGLVRMIARPGVASIVGALVRFAVAAYLVVVIEHIGGWTLAATWPVLLIALGTGTVAHGLLGRRWHEEPNW